MATMSSSSARTGARRVVGFALGVVVPALILTIGACSRLQRPHHLPVKVSGEGYRLKIYFAPDNVRVFLFDEKGLPVDIESAGGLIIFRKEHDVLSTHSLDNVESIIEVPRDMMQAYMDAMPWLDSGDWAEAGDTKYTRLSRRFFWAGLGHDTDISSATRAEIILSRLPDREHPIHVETHIRFTYLQGFVCPKHTSRVGPDPSPCRMGGLQKEPVPSLYRCPMDEGVASLDEHELCWECGMTLEWDVLHQDH